MHHRHSHHHPHGRRFAHRSHSHETNRKLALRMRLSRGPLSGEQVNAVAAAIDIAATSVEWT